MPRPLQTLHWAHRYAEFTERCRQRYGPTYTVRVGGLPAGVVTCDPQLVDRVLHAKPEAMRHGRDMLAPIAGERSILVLEPKQHLDRRRLLLPVFRAERVAEYGALMTQLLDRALADWREGDVIRLFPFAQDLTLEVILSAVLGVQDPGLRARLRVLFDAMHVSGSNVAVYIPQASARRRWNLAAKPFWVKKDQLDAMLLEHVQQSRHDPRLAARTDVLAAMLRSADLDDLDLRDELCGLLSAGHETTAAGITWTVEYLARDPDAWARVRGGDEAYLQAAILEALRLRTPLMVGAARVPQQPFDVGNGVVCAPNLVMVDAWGLHHDPQLYPSPHAFRPERFLGRRPPRSEFCPFGGGAHRCLGEALALLELRLAVGAIVKRFDLVPQQREVSGAHVTGITVVPAHRGAFGVARAHG